MILNGIEAIARRQDLLDRALVVSFQRIEPSKRIPEDQLWRELEQARPRILRALLEVVASALVRLPEIEVGRLPRLADFARWIAACEPALKWEEGDFVSILETKQATVLRDSLEGSVVASKLDLWLGTHEWDWEGTPQTFFAELSLFAGDAAKRKPWPSNAQSMSVTLSRLVPALRLAGIEIERSHQGRGADKIRWLKIWDPARVDAGDAGDA